MAFRIRIRSPFSYKAQVFPRVNPQFFPDLFSDGYLSSSLDVIFATIMGYLKSNELFALLLL